MALWRPYKEMKMGVAAPVLTCLTATAWDGFLPRIEVRGDVPSPE